MQKLGFSLQSNYTMPIPEVLKRLRSIGFHAVSATWHHDGSLQETVKAAERCGLVFQSLHGPFRGLPGMWSRDQSLSGPLFQGLMAAAEDCAAYGIPVLVVHSWGGLDYTFREDCLFYDNFDRLVEYAARKEFQIAFENLEGPEYLNALLARYRDCPAVGLCWDSGHELCYTPSWDFLDTHGDRLLMTHLNDNYGITHPEGLLQGTDDLHTFPFDGITDWPKTMDRLNHARKQQILNFELKIRPKGDRCKTDLYSSWPLDRYWEAAYERACRAVSGYCW